MAQFFIPIFFVSVGAAIDLRTLSPLDPATRKYLVIGVALTVVAIVGKVLAGYAAGRGHRRLLSRRAGARVNSFGSMVRRVVTWQVRRVGVGRQFNAPLD